MDGDVEYAIKAQSSLVDDWKDSFARHSIHSFASSASLDLYHFTSRSLPPSLPPCPSLAGSHPRPSLIQQTLCPIDPYNVTYLLHSSPLLIAAQCVPSPSPPSSSSSPSSSALYFSCIAVARYSQQQQHQRNNLLLRLVLRQSMIDDDEDCHRPNTTHDLTLATDVQFV